MLKLKKVILEGDVLRSKDYMKKAYKRFCDFVAECSSKELEYFIFDSKFTTDFNEKIGEMIKDIRDQGKESVEFTIMFNTEGEIALIDSFIIGKYIGNNYNVHMEQYYKESYLNKIVKYVVNGNKKVKKDFVLLSFNILYNTLESIYCDIKCKKETLNKYKNLYNLQEYEENNCSIIVGTILILEDICKYMGIKQEILEEAVNYHWQKKNSQNN